MPRKYCATCTFPLVTCLCHVRNTVHCKTRFYILRHPTEAVSAKNTARLVKLCLPNTQILNGESEADFLALKTNLEKQPDQTVVLYPSPQAQQLPSPDTSIEHSPKREPKSVILIDATWRKAYKMWMINPWLRNFEIFKLSNITSEYHIRSSKLEGALSTLECAYYCLKLFEPEVDSEQLLSLFYARQQSLKGPVAH